jgi:hypothetical protein
MELDYKNQQMSGRVLPDFGAMNSIRNGSEQALFLLDQT